MIILIVIKVHIAVKTQIFGRPTSVVRIVTSGIKLDLVACGAVFLLPNWVTMITARRRLVIIIMALTAGAIGVRGVVLPSLMPVKTLLSASLTSTSLLGKVITGIRLAVTKTSILTGVRA